MTERQAVQQIELMEFRLYASDLNDANY